ARVTGATRAARRLSIFSPASVSSLSAKLCRGPIVARAAVKIACISSKAQAVLLAIRVFVVMGCDPASVHSRGRAQSDPLKTRQQSDRQKPRPRSQGQRTGSADRRL